MNATARILSLFAMGAGALGTVAFFALIGEAKSAPQEAARSAMIMAPVICMYVFARGADMIAGLQASVSNATH